jgi:hypothetical protein
VGLCAQNHPFAGKTIPLNALWDEHLILREEGSGTRNILEQMLAEQNHTVKEFHRVTTISNFGLMTKLLPATGGITFANPFFIDVTGLADRSLTVDVAGTRPFKRLDVVATGIGDVVWSQDFPQTATTFKGMVPASAADFTRGLTDTLIEGHTLVITYADGTVKSVHAPQEKTRTKRE